MVPRVETLETRAMLAASVAFQLSASSIGEDGSPATITAVLTTDGETLSSDAVFNVAAITGSAELNDFLVTSQIIFASGSGNGAQQQITFTPQSDTLVEGDETVTLQLSQVSGSATVGSQATHQVTIQDADTATVSLLAATTTSYSNTTPINPVDRPTDLANSDPGLASEYPSTINVSGLTGTVLKVTVSFTLTSTAPDDLDILLVGPTGAQSLLMSDAGGIGNVSNAVFTFDQLALNALPNNTTEGTPISAGTYRPSNFSGLSTTEPGGQDNFPTAGGLASYPANLDVFNGLNPNGAWRLYVVDDQTSDLSSLVSGWTLNITTTTTNTLNEDGGVGGMTAVLTMAAGNTLEEAAVFDVSTLLTTAESNDFGLSGSQITFAAGSSNGASQALNLTTNSDNLVEGTEQLTVQIARNSGAATVAPGQGAQAYTILDADAATVSFTQSTSTRGEEESAINLVATLDTAEGNVLENAAVFSVTPTGGTAEPEDYTLNTPTITFAANSGNGVSQNVTVTPASDTLVESPETVTLTLAPTSGAATVGSTASNTLTITDGDAATVSFQSASSTAEEDGANVELTVVLSTGGSTLAEAVSFTVTVMAGTAQPGDYELITTVVTFAATSGDGTTQTIVLDPQSDNLVEGDQTVIVSITPSSGPATVGSQGSHTVTIHDADTATVAFEFESSSRGEDAGAATLNVILTTAEGNVLESGAVFNLSTTNGNAENEDYQLTTAQIAFAANDGNGTSRSVLVTPQSDNLVEGSETVNVHLALGSGAATLGGTTTHVLTITDADAATVSFQTTNYSRGEDAGAVNLIAVLDAGAGNALENGAEFTITTSLGTAESIDFTLQTLTVTFEGGAMNGDQRQVQITPTSDTLVEGAETVDVSLVYSSGVAGVGPTGTTTLTIIDADVATVAFASSGSTVSEDSPTDVTLTAVLSMAAGLSLENDAVVDVTTSTSNAEDEDFTLNATRITFTAAGSTNGQTQSVTVTPHADTLVEGTETINFNLVAFSGPATVGTPGTYVLTLTDEDTATISYAESSSSAGEDAGEKLITVVLDTNGSTLENAATFNVTAAPGTALANDYTLNTPQITFTAGSGDADEVSVRITPTQDNLVEGDQTVTLNLTSAGGPVSVSGNSSHVLTINDADAATVSFQTASSTTGEDGGAATGVVVVLSTNGDLLESSATFTITPTNVSTENPDYVLGTTQVTFNANDGDGATRTVTVTPNSDTLVEGDEKLNLTLGVLSGVATPGGTTTHELTIIDTDTATVSFALASRTVGEDGGQVSLIVTLTTAQGNTLAEDAIFSVNPTLVSAEVEDFTLNTPTITFGATSGNGAQQTVLITPTPDALVEGTETLDLVLSVAAGPGTVGSQGTHTLTILDADTPTVNFLLASSSTIEDDGDFDVTVVLTVPEDGELDEDAVFNVVIARDSAEEEDYELVTAQVTFEVGSGNGATRTVTIKTLADTLVEGSETLTISLEYDSGPAEVGLDNSHLLTIVDSDSATVSFQQASSSHAEGSGAASLIVVLTTTDATLENAATFDVSAILGNAEAADFDLTTTLITFAATSGNNAQQTVSITPEDDTLVEGNETLTVRLTAASGVATVLNGDHALTITDADTATVSFNQSSSSTGEDLGAVDLVVTLNTGGNTLEAGAIFDVTINQGNSEGVADYIQGTAQVTFLATSGDGTTALVRITPQSDGLVEGNETITVNLTRNSGAATVAGGSHVLTITDADSASVSFQQASSTPGENSGSTGLIVVLTTSAGAVLENAASFTVTTALGTAEPNDLSLVTTMVTFNAGDGDGVNSMRTVTVNLVADNRVEGPETFNVNLTYVSGDAPLGGTASHQVTIIDADTATVAFQQASSSAGENGGKTSPVVVLTMAVGDVLENDAVFSVTADLVSASANDFTLTTTDFVFEAGAMNGETVTVDLTPTPDTRVEGPEVLNLVLGVTSGAATPGTISSHELTITDEDAASAEFQIASTSVSENSGQIAINVILTTNGAMLQNAATFNVGLLLGSAEAADFVLDTTTVTFPANSGNGTVQTVLLTLANDTLIEGDETFTLTLTPASGAATLGSQATHDVTIQDADHATVSFEVASSSALEGSGQKTLNVILSTNGNTLENAASFNVSATNGTAIDLDYTLDTSLITFAANSGDGAVQGVLVTPLDDVLVEGSQDFTVALAIAGGVVTLGGTPSHVLTVLDADSATVSFQSVSSSRGEAQGQTALIAVLQTEEGNLLESAATFNVSATDVSTGTGDYSLDTSSIIFAANSGNNAQQSVFVTPIQDTRVEQDEVVNVSLAYASGAASLGSPSTHALTITDDDTASVAFVDASSTTSEDGTQISITVRLTTSGGSTLQNAATFSVSVLLGTAEDEDFVLDTTSITFDAGDGDGSTRTILLTPQSDTLIEADDTLTLQLARTAGAATVGSQGTHLVTITDADAATASFQTASSTVGENDTQTLLIVVLSTNGNTLEDEATFNITRTLGTAEEWDFSLSTSTITFAAGSGDGVQQQAQLLLNPDDLVEGSETVTFNLVKATGVVPVGATPSHEVTITDADFATVSFAVAASSRGEDDGAFNVVAILNMHQSLSLEGSVTFSVSAAGVSAEPEDFTLNTTQITFTAGEQNGATRDVQIAPTEDSLIEGNETVNLSLTHVSGAASVGGQSTHLLTITDADFATVSFQAASSTHGENDGQIELTVVLSTNGNTLENDAVFSITRTLGNAEDPDFTLDTTSITFDAGTGSTTATVFVTLIDDALIEGDETVTFTLGVTSGAATVGSTPSHVVTITDADVATVSFQAASSSTGENDGQFAVIAVLSTNGNFLEEGATFSVSTTLGTAEDEDFALDTTLISFAANDGDGTQQTIFVTPLEDNLVEGNETLTLHLTRASGAAAVGATPEHVLTITDANLATVKFNQSALTRDEDLGSATVDVELVMAEGDVLAEDAVISLNVTLGSAEANDFTHTTSITFEAGQGNGALQSVTVTPQADTFVEGDETFTLTLQPTSGPATVGTPGSLDVTIIDADFATVSFQSAFSSRGEDLGQTGLIVVLSTTGGSTLENAATFNLGTTHVSTEDGDFTLDTTSITFDAGDGDQDERTVFVTPHTDTLVEGDEVVNVTLSVSAGVATLGTNATHALSILDADSASVSFDVTSSTTAEGDPTVNLTVTLTTTGGSTLENAATFDVQILLGNAELADVNLLTSLLTFAATSGNGVQQTVSIAALSDTSVEGTETLDLNLSQASGVVTVNSGIHALTITDEDTATVSFETGLITVGENAGQTGLIAVLRTTGGSTLENNATFTVSTTPNSAIASDYSLDTTTITFTASSGDGAEQTVFITPINDDLVEGPEAFFVNLAYSSGAASVGSTPTTTVFITDADTATVSLEVSTRTVSENAGQISLAVTLSMAANLSLEDPLTVAVSTTHGNTEALDFTLDTIFVTFPASSINGTTATILITLTNDDLVEGDESFTASIAPLGTAVTLGTFSQTVVTITDADVATVSFEESSSSSGEDNGPHTITAVLSMLAGLSLENAATFSVGTTLGTAEVNDFTLGTSTITFAANSTNNAQQTITITPTMDNRVEGPETVTLNLTRTGGAATVAGGSHVYTIEDADLASVSFQQASSTVGENSTSTNVVAVLTMTPGNVLENAASFNVSTSNLSAESNDYVLNTISITFAANSANNAQQSINLSLIDDMLVEGNETLNVNLGYAGGPVTVDAGTHALTIVDGDAATVSFVPAASSIGEDGGNAGLNVVLSMAAGVTLENNAVFDVSTTLGTAEAEDFDLLTQQITFIAGSGSNAIQTVFVDPLSDTLVEGSETLSVHLAINSDAVTIAGEAHVLTIVDDDGFTASFELDSSSAAEDGGGRTINVILTTNSGATLAEDAVFSIMTILGSAEANDFGLSTTQITFAAGSGNNTVESVTFTPNSDNRVEGPETVLLQLGVVSGAATVGSVPGHLVTIVDADTATVSYNVSVSSRGEDAGQASIAVTLSMAPGNVLENAATFNVTAVPGSAEAADYILNTPTITFSAGSGNGAVQQVGITPQSDNLTEGSETVQLQLSINDGAAGLGALTTHTLTITDADVGTVSFVTGFSQLGEYVGHAVLTVRLSIAPGTQLGEDAVFSVTAVPNTAQAADYLLKTLQVTFGAGSVNGATRDVVVELLSDAFQEVSEQFSVQLARVSGGPTGGPTTSHLFTIVDTELDGRWQFADRLTTVQQVGGTLTFFNENGQSSAGIFLSDSQVMATGWGNLIGTIDTTTADRGRIIWANGTVWQRISLGGQYTINEAGLPQVIQVGSQITFVNENGGTSAGQILSPTQVIATNWGNLIGTITQNGAIQWSNGSRWRKLDLSPDYTTAIGGLATKIRQNGTILTFVDANGVTSLGRWISANQVQLTGSGRIGTVSNGQIQWSDGSAWNKNLTVFGTINVGGVLKTVTLKATNQGVVAFNENGGDTPLRITGVDQLFATKWQLGASRINGKIRFANNTLWENFDFNALNAIFSDVTSYPFL